MSGMNSRQAFTLFFCYFLSAWNARCYEFVAALFAHAAYPGGLRAASFVGISTSLAVVLFGSSIGRWIDNAPSRLRALLTTIAINRTVVVFASLLWFTIVEESDSKDSSKNGHGKKLIGLLHNSIDTKDPSFLHGHMKAVVFTLVLALGVLETLSRRANVISIQRDWVPVLAPPTVEKSAKNEWTLVKVDATMTGINMVCELLAPFVVSGFLAFVGSMRVAVIAVGFVSGFSVWFEIAIAKWIASQFPQLKYAKQSSSRTDQQYQDSIVSSEIQPRIAWYARPILPFVSLVRGTITSCKIWLSLDVCLASLAMCILHANLLSISSTTVVFLLNSGYSLRLVTAAEAVSAAFEFTSTILTPLSASWLSKAQVTEWKRITQEIGAHEGDEEDFKADVFPHRNATWAISRIGLFGISQMCLTLAPTIPLFIILTTTLHYPISRNDGAKDVTFHSHPLITVCLLSCLAASRLGRGTFGLVTTQLAQAKVPDNVRASFAGVELSLGQLFGLLHNLGTAIYSQPKDYGWISCASFIAVATSTGIYSKWFLRERDEERNRRHVLPQEPEDSVRVYGTFEDD